MHSPLLPMKAFVCVYKETAFIKSMPQLCQITQCCFQYYCVSSLFILEWMNSKFKIYST